MEKEKVLLIEQRVVSGYDSKAILSDGESGDHVYTQF